MKKILPTSKFYLLYLSLFYLICSPVQGQIAGDLDLTFNPTDAGYGQGKGANNDVRKVFVQPDGKIIIAGTFTSYNGNSRKGIARVNPDGTLDTTFDPGTGSNTFSIFDVALQPDGKVLLAGNFTSFNGVNQASLARLNSDGSVDTSFNPEIGSGGAVHALLVQPDGKIVIGGSFSYVNQYPRYRLARINPDGSLDTAFNSALIPTRKIISLAIQPDGKILFGEDWEANISTPTTLVYRLNPDGSADSTFTIGSGPTGPANNFNCRITAVLSQPDGKIILSGNFTEVNGTPRNRIARLNSNGSVDLSFDPGGGFPGVPSGLLLQPDGKVVAMGYFLSYDGIPSRFLTRINTNGSFDFDFALAPGAHFTVQGAAILPNGQLVIGGRFEYFNNEAVTRLARLNSDGSLDTSFNQVTGANNVVETSLTLPDGKILIAGSFTSYNGQTSHCLAKLLPDGTPDPDFTSPPIGTNLVNSLRINALAVQPDGKILAGGDFAVYAPGFAGRGVMRLHPNGSLDSTFNLPGEGLLGWVEDITVLPDGRILIAGYLDELDGAPTQGIIRLHPDGSIDQSFNPGFAIGNSVQQIALQPDSKILFTRDFYQFNGITHIRIGRLNTDGTVDASFTPGTGPDEYVTDLELLPSGQILIAGNFSSFNGTPRNRIARLNSDGSLDTAFDPGSGPNNIIWSISTQPDGKIVAGGQFTDFAGTGIPRLVRLHPNGTPDTGFNPGSSANSAILHAAVQPDGNILIGGEFMHYNGVGRNHLARVWGTTINASSEGLQTKFSVYPNPASSRLRVNLGGKAYKQVEIELVNLLGQSILYRKFADGVSPELALAAIPEGAYLIRIRTEDQATTQHLVIQH